MPFQTGEQYHGFTVTRVRALDEIHATLIEMTHTQSGARLCWCKTTEQNKLFCVTFKTLPENSTGVFHILEHSVLCGSERFPVREPFVELLKGSMNTFLNAMTFPDKTMYPVSSRNARDFLNLTEVYLDAVFAPEMLRNPCIFMQEGWHVETEGRGQAASLKGVVLNEMKGAMSSVDEVMEQTTSSTLFPDNCYGFNSGGDPTVIPELTYEQFIATYRRYYHPDNALIWLDGDIPAEETFALLESYLNRFTATGKTIDLQLQPRRQGTQVHGRYAISADEDPEGKAHILFARLMSDWSDKTQDLALSVLLDAVAGGNDSPFKRAILDAGLGQDLNASVQDGVQQTSVNVWVRNTSPDKLDAIREALRRTAEQLVAGGIDRKDLEASINRLAFRLKEPNEPQGLFRAIMAQNSWLYGGDPALYLTYDRELKALRDMLETDAYERLLKDVFLSPEDTHEIILTPDPALDAQLREEEQQKLNHRLAEMDDDTFNHLLDDNRRLIAWQQTPDSPEAHASLPQLSLDEVSSEPEKTPTGAQTIDGITVLHHPAACPGISHINMYLRLGELTPEALTDVALLPAMLGELPTARHTVTELQREIKLYTGAFDIDLEPISLDEDPTRCAVYLTASFSALKENVARAAALVTEVLTETDFSNDQLIREILLQTDDDLRQSVIMAGHRYAVQRVSAHYSALGAAGEYLSGLTLVQRSHAVCAGLPESLAVLRAQWQRALADTVCRRRLTVSVTGEPVDARALWAGLPEGEPAPEMRELRFDAPLREAFVVPSQVSYAAMAWSLHQEHTPYNATASVLSNILSYGYLWNTVRVQGGAYGVSFSLRRTGSVTVSSYRDPSPARTLDAYRGMPDFIRAFAGSGESLTPYIISTVGQADPLVAPRQQGKLADLRWFKGITDEKRRQDRARALGMTMDDLTAWTGTLEALAAQGAVCVVGHADAVAQCEPPLSAVTLS